MLETKHLPAEECEFKFSDEDYRIEGYASTFNGNDTHKDTIVPGAFSKFLSQKRVPIMRFEHIPWLIPGKWMALSEDNKGLHIDGQLTRGHSLAEDLRASMRHGTIRGLSIGYPRPGPGTFDVKSDGGRILREINLIEVSFTHAPSDRNAVVESFKSEVAAIATLGDLEDFLRDAGNMSKSMACTLISQMKAVCLGDPDEAKVRVETVKQLKSVLDKYDIRKLIKP